MKKKNKKKEFDEELWGLFQEMRGAGKELVLSIEKANYKNMGRFNSMTEHMAWAIQGWKHFEDQYREWLKN